jgi:2-(1,2-epoxy-1,2-dihydrophenyl)acetyl-CoA isomerase
VNYKNLLIEKREGILTVTFNRPKQLNALTQEANDEIIDLFESIADQNDVRVVILTGAGKAFCAGADMSLLDIIGEGSPDEVRAKLDRIIRMALIFQKLEKPIIAAINGYALGQGLNLAVACDIRIASDTAILGEEFINMVLFPDLGGAYLLQQLLGPAKAKEMTFTGDRISAREAENIGLVNRVVPAASLMDETYALARNLASKSPLAMAISKRVFHIALMGAIENTFNFEASLQSMLAASRDHKEAVAAFIEKRKPVFTGK